MTIDNQRSGQRTLLASMLLSAPGPLVLGIGLLVGSSSTQLADFIRRTVELVAIIISWAIHGATTNDSELDLRRRRRLERIADVSVGAAMCIGGLAMLLISFLSTERDKGNVIPGLVIDVLGVIVNTWFWFHYRRLNKQSHNSILAVQSRLYRAKSLVDCAVVAALATVVVAPGSSAAYFMDKAGSAVVAVYLIVNGVMAALERSTSST